MMVQFFFRLDHAVQAWFNAHRTPLGTTLMRDVTALGGHAVLTLIVFFTVGLLVVLGRRRTAGFVLAAVLGGVVLDDAAKSLIGRPRPEVSDPTLMPFLPHTPSFPSGHSLLAAVIYPTLALVVAGQLRRKRLAAYLVGSSLALAFLVGWSRLYLGVHYFTDVIAGWVTGLAWALACRRLEDWWLAKGDRLPPMNRGSLAEITRPEEEPVVLAAAEIDRAPQSQPL
jgi:undecaprenyl-diphosphatase